MVTLCGHIWIEMNLGIEPLSQSSAWYHFLSYLLVAPSVFLQLCYITSLSSSYLHVQHGVYKLSKEQKSVRKMGIYMGTNFFIIKIKAFGQIFPL